MTPRVKICGLARADDVALAGALDVDAVGFVLWPGSPRAVSAAHAGRISRVLPPWMARVGVFVTPTVDEVREAVRTASLSAVQLHGVRDPAPFVALGVPVLWAASFEDESSTPAAPPDTTLLLDALDPVGHGGTGRTVDWARAAAVAATERLVRPAAVSRRTTCVPPSNGCGRTASTSRPASGDRAGHQVSGTPAGVRGRGASSLRPRGPA